MTQPHIDTQRDRKGEACIARRVAALLPVVRLAPRVAASLLSILVSIACNGKNVPPQHKDAPVIGTTQQAATVDLDESYVVMGRKSVHLKSNSDVHSGNVGVSFSPAQYPVAGDACYGGNIENCYVGGVPLEVGQFVDVSVTGSKLFGSSVRTRKNVHAAEIYYLTSLTIGDDNVVGSSQQVTSAFFPLFPQLPTPPSADPAGENEGHPTMATIAVAQNATLCLPPGTYKDVTVARDGTLYFAPNCAQPTVPGAGAVYLRDVTLDQRAKVHFNAGPVRLRDARLGTEAEMKIQTGTHYLRDLWAQSKAKLVLGSGTFHLRNLRTDQDVKTTFMAPQQTEFRVLNKAHIGSNNDFNSLGYGANDPVDSSLIRLYVRGLDGPNAMDGTLMGASDDDPFQPKPRAVLVGQYSKLHANVMALGTGTGSGATIYLSSNSVGIGSYFADHVIVGQHVDLTNRNGLVGQASGDPSYLDGDADNDGVADETDNCLTIPNPTQVDSDADTIGDTCDNCPSVPNPVQERASPNSETDFTGAACASPVLPYCGDGVVQTANGEQCDEGFANHGYDQPCSLYCQSNLPVITEHPQSQTVEVGQSATFTVVATGNNLTYQWRKNDIPISEATSASYTISSVVPGDAGGYRVAVSTLAGAVLSNVATLTVGTCAGTDDDCDGVDDDCNGQIDEDYQGQSTSCGVGACAATGSTSCVSGNVIDSCNPGSPASDDATCDGIDADCDGQVDEEYDSHATSCGVGACHSTGSTSCVAGFEQDSCAPGTPPAADDAACDGIDNDCSGQTDEDYVSVSTNCGVGACASTGSTSCPAGSVVDSCTPGEPESQDTMCDDVDEDCDGQTDEEYIVLSTQCGVGGCQSDGLTSCVDGLVHDSCEPGTPAGDDETCDGIDADCDGQVDEEYDPHATTCGVGGCHSTGVTSCAQGIELDSCSPGAPAANDAMCDGVDANCDGFTDEDYTPVATSCGVGACEASGITSCVSGSEQDSCTPGEGSMDDTSCDGSDDDCDGSEDDDYAPVTTSCGVGACASTAPTTCDMGTVIDHCTPGTPGANDASCNGVDEDCSGQNDEDFAPACSGTVAQNCVSGSIQSTQCNDNNTCNGQETCAAGSCNGGTAPTQDDGNVCTADSCDPQGGVQHNPLPYGTSCGSYMHCNGAGSCTDMPPVITQQPQTVTVTAGQSFGFSVTAQGNGLIYQWQRYRQNISGANTASYNKPSADFSDNNGAYRVIVSNGAGSAVSNEAILTVTDTVPPVLTVIGDTTRSTSLDLITLAGTATDVGVGVASVAVTSDQFPGQQFGALFDAATTVFDAEVPLLAGVNVLTVIAKDGANNQATQVITVTQVFGSTPIVRIVSPASGSTVQTPLIDVEGTVASTLPANLIRMELGGLVAFPTGATPPYAFVFEDVRLIRGPNTLIVRAITPETTVTAETIVTYGDAPTTSNEPPRISVAGATSQMYVTTSSLQVSGTVSDDRCVSGVTVNGTAAQITGSGANISFRANVDLSGASGAVPITVRADDCDGAYATLSYSVTRDATGPVISTPGLSSAPAVNTVSVTPYRVMGWITEDNLAGVSSNDQSVRVLPGATPDRWDFAVDVALVTNQPGTLHLEAWDKAGNLTDVDLSFVLDAVLNIEVIAPPEGRTLLVDGPNQSENITARIVGINPADSVYARLDSGSPILLALSGATATGSFILPETTGSHTLTVYVQSSGGQVLATKAVSFRTEDADDVVLKVDRVEPANDAVNLETNQFVSLFFNKPIDPEKLAMQVYETAHSKAFVEPEPGADLRTVGQINTVTVDHERKLVDGGIGHFPGHTMAAFYPRNKYTFGSELEVVVTYDGDELHKSQFKIRPFPTLYYGFLVDNFGNPIAGVDVSLRELGKTSTSDESGYFSFGFGDFSDSVAGGRYRLDINSALKAQRYGASQRWVNIPEGALTRAGMFSTVSLDQSEPYRHLESGQVEALLREGDLKLLLSNAGLVFPNGASDGDVHAQLVGVSELHLPPAAADAIPFVGYSLNPPGIEVEGSLGIRLRLPEQGGSHEWLTGAPRYVVFIGYDRTALQLVPVGVGEIDPQTFTVSSVGNTRFTQLDFIGVSFALSVDQALLAAYANGTATLDQVITEVMR